jgi:RHS repeat-associated protein
VSTRSLGSPSTVTTTYQHGTGGASPHQVTSVMSSAEGSPLADVAFEYDDAGNRVTATSGAETNSYDWDVEGELVADDDYEYVYDASGSRIVRSGADGLTVYLPGGQEITIEGATVSATRYYSFAGSTVAVRSGKGLGGVTSLVSDRDGSVVAAVPNTVWTSTSVERVYPDPFGGIRGGSDAGVPGDRRFLGATLDADSGLTLLGARYYDAALGRFISVDPLLDLGVPGHFNAYSYAYNNPMTFSDPSGMEPAGEKIGLGKKPGTAGTPPPSTSWAALAACSDFWCQQGWHWSTSTQVLGGLAENIGQLVWSTVAPPGAVEGITNLVDMISDWDGFWARQEEERQAQLDFWSGPDPWGEAWNSFWAPIANDWVNNPGHALGGTIATVGTFAVPGGGLIKGASVAAKGAKAATVAAHAGADNVANGARLAEQLAKESAESAFTASGELSEGAIAGSRIIMTSDELGNTALPGVLTSDGSRFADWAKYATATHQSPSGNFQVHFYQNQVSGAINYSMDYKAVFNRR